MINNIQIPPTSKCCLSCKTCIKSVLPYVQYYMKFNKFKKIITHLPLINNIDMTPIVGEIFMDEHIQQKFNLLDISSNVKSYSFVTNLSAPNLEISNIFTKCTKLKHICISIYGWDKNSFNSYTNSNQWYTFFENFKLLTKYVILTKTEITLYLRCCEWVDFPKDNKLYSLMNVLRSFSFVQIDDESAYNNFDWSGRMPGIKYLAPLPQKTNECLNMREQKCVWPNGDVSLCGLADYNKNMIIGNIYKNDITQLLSVYKTHNLCNKCREYEKLKT